MKTSMDIDWSGKKATLSITLETLEDAGFAIDFVKGAATMVWPEIEFVEARPEKQSRLRDWSKPPPAGSMNERVLAFLRKRKRVDVVEVADEFDLQTGMASMRIAQLRKGGHLEGLE